MTRSMTGARGVRVWSLPPLAACIVSMALGDGRAFAQNRAASADGEPPPYPRLVTAATRESPPTLAALETPGTVFFRDDFESPDSLQ